MSVEDDAQAVELLLWEINNRPRPEVKRYAPGERGYGPEFCSDDDCGAVMPAKRREWGFSVCTECQTAAEKAAKHFRR